jgi:hypothetical protein
MVWSVARKLDQFDKKRVRTASAERDVQLSVRDRHCMFWVCCTLDHVSSQKGTLRRAGGPYSGV